MRCILPIVVALLALVPTACGLFAAPRDDPGREGPPVGREVVGEDLTDATGEFEPALVLETEDLPLLAGAEPQGTRSSGPQVQADDAAPESGAELAEARNPPSLPPGAGERPAVEWLDALLESVVIVALAGLLTLGYGAASRFPKSSMLLVASAGLGLVVFALLS